MKYFYEYKYKKGNRVVGGHNLEKIIVQDDTIILNGCDMIPTHYSIDDCDYDTNYWEIPLNMHEVEYLKIETMEEEVDYE